MKNKKNLLASLILVGIAGKAAPFSKMSECNDIISSDGTIFGAITKKLSLSDSFFKPGGVYKDEEFVSPKNNFGACKMLLDSYILDEKTNICLFNRRDNNDLKRLFLSCKSMFEEQQTWDRYLDERLKGMKIVCSKEEPLEIYKQVFKVSTGSNNADSFLANKVEELNIAQDLESLSGIKVHNKPEGGVELSREGGQSIDFQAALEKYIKKFGLSFGDANGEIGNAITDENGTAEAIKNLLFSSKVPYDRDALPLLKDSRILTVFHLLKTTLVNAENKEEKKTVNQKLFGFAADKEGKVFAWSTDLGQDIEVLYD